MSEQEKTVTEIDKAVFSPGDGGVAVSLLETLKTREDGEEHRSYELKFSVSHFSVNATQQVFIGPEMIIHLFGLLEKAGQGLMKNKKSGYRPDPKQVERGERDNKIHKLKVFDLSSLDNDDSGEDLNDI